MSVAVRWPQASIFLRADPVVFGPYGPSAAQPITGILACIPCDTRWSGWDSLLCWCCGQPGTWPPPEPVRAEAAGPVQVATAYRDAPAI